MATKTDPVAITNITTLFTKIFMKYDVIQKKPVSISNGVNLTAAQIHIIEAIGKANGNTVTKLSTYFMITRGAVSQVVTKLHKDGYLVKAKEPGNDKNIILELTDRGWEAFNLHEAYNNHVMSDFEKISQKYTTAEWTCLQNMLTDVDVFFGKFINT